MPTYNTTTTTSPIQQQVGTGGAATIVPNTITSSTYAIGTGLLAGAGISAATINPAGYINTTYSKDFVFYGNDGREIVRLNSDGSITWKNGYQVDEAAENFGRMMKLGAEMAVGITARVKHDMRDSVFEDLIEIAKQKGSLSAEDLTYLLNASKIVEKLKGGK